MGMVIMQDASHRNGIVPAGIHRDARASCHAGLKGKTPFGVPSF